MAKGGTQINQLAFNVLGELYTSQSQTFPKSISDEPKGQLTNIYDDDGNLLLEHQGAPRPIIKSFFKGPIGDHANDNGFFGQSYFEISYEDFNYAKLEYTVARKGLPPPVQSFPRTWIFTEEYYWSIKSDGTPILQIYSITDAYSTEGSTDTNFENNNVTNFSLINNTAPNDALQPHFDQFTKTVKFCRPFGAVGFEVSPPSYNEFGGQITFAQTPCYIKGLATLM